MGKFGPMHTMDEWANLVWTGECWSWMVAEAVGVSDKSVARATGL